MPKSVVLEFVNQFWATLPMWIRKFTAMHRYDYSDVILNPRCFWCPFCGFVMWCRVRCNATWKSCSFCVLLLFFGLSTLRCAWIVGYLTCAGWNAKLFSRFQPHFMLMLDKLPPKDIKRLKMWEHFLWSPILCPSMCQKQLLYFCGCSSVQWKPADLLGPQKHPPFPTISSSDSHSFVKRSNGGQCQHAKSCFWAEDFSVILMILSTRGSGGEKHPFGSHFWHLHSKGL